MKAMIRDGYGSSDVLALDDIATPVISQTRAVSPCAAWKALRVGSPGGAGRRPSPMKNPATAATIGHAAVHVVAGVPELLTPAPAWLLT